MLGKSTTEVRPDGEPRASERLRRQLDEVIDGAGEKDDPIEAIGPLGARSILQQRSRRS